MHPAGVRTVTMTQTVTRFWQTAKHRQTMQRWKRFCIWHLRQVHERTIDFIYNVDTFGPALDDEHAGRWAHAYDTGPWSAPLKMLKRLRLNFAQSSFIDMGSGKGRVVLAASTLPFVTVIGVEFSPALCRIARKNIANCRILYQRAKQTSILEIDAAQFAAPNTPCIFYFYNPFHRDLMKTVISKYCKFLSR